MLRTTCHKEELNLNFVPTIRTTYTGYDFVSSSIRSDLIRRRSLRSCLGPLVVYTLGLNSSSQFKVLPRTTLYYWYKF